MYAPELARGLFGHFVGAIRGSSQYRRTSFLLEAAGKPVFPDFLQIAERPHLPQGLASSPFDAEGVTTRDRELVRDGVLTGYVLGSYSARRLGLTTTGNAGGIHNLLVSPSSADSGFEQMLRQMGEGLLVTELMGPGVNGVTGDYSRGASGFWVEGGAIAFPVHEVTIASNLRDMFRGIVAVGTRRRYPRRDSHRLGSHRRHDHRGRIGPRDSAGLNAVRRSARAVSWTANCCAPGAIELLAKCFDCRWHDRRVVSRPAALPAGAEHHIDRTDRLGIARQLQRAVGGRGQIAGGHQPARDARDGDVGIFQAHGELGYAPGRPRSRERSATRYMMPRARRSTLAAERRGSARPSRR